MNDCQPKVLPNPQFSVHQPSRYRRTVRTLKGVGGPCGSASPSEAQKNKPRTKNSTEPPNPPVPPLHHHHHPSVPCMQLRSHRFIPSVRVRARSRSEDITYSGKVISRQAGKPRPGRATRRQRTGPQPRHFRVDWTSALRRHRASNRRPVTWYTVSESRGRQNHGGLQIRSECHMSKLLSSAARLEMPNRKSNPYSGLVQSYPNPSPLYCVYCSLKRPSYPYATQEPPQSESAQKTKTPV